MIDLTHLSFWILQSSRFLFDVAARQGYQSLSNRVSQNTKLFRLKYLRPVRQMRKQKLLYQIN